MIRLRAPLSRLLANDLETLLTVAAVMDGMAVVTWRTHPESIAYLLPDPVYIAWGCLLLVGGLMNLYGIAADKITPRKIGLQALLGPGAAIYGAAIIAYVGVNVGIVAGLIQVLLGAGLWLRGYNVARRYRHQLDAAWQKYLLGRDGG